MGSYLSSESASEPKAELEPEASKEAKRPRILYGTAWKKEKTADLVYEALKIGYRGIDTAAQPENYHEAGVGEGLKRAIDEGIVSRNKVFVRLLI